MEVLLTYNVNKLSRFLWYLDLCEIPPLNLLKLQICLNFPAKYNIYQKIQNAILTILAGKKIKNIFGSEYSSEN